MAPSIGNKYTIKSHIDDDTHATHGLTSSSLIKLLVGLFKFSACVMCCRMRQHRRKRIECQTISSAFCGIHC